MKSLGVIRPVLQIWHASKFWGWGVFGLAVHDIILVVEVLVLYLCLELWI